MVANLREKKAQSFPLPAHTYSLFLSFHCALALNEMARGRAAKLLLLWLHFKRCQLKQALSATVVLRLWDAARVPLLALLCVIVLRARVSVCIAAAADFASRISDRFRDHRDTQILFSLVV